MRRTAVLVLTLAVSLFGATTAFAWPANWTKPVRPYRVVGSIYYVGTEGLSAYLIASSEGHILVDGGAPEASGKLIEASIRQLGFKVEDVKILVNTHAHLDHAGGLAQLKADTGAKLYASREDKPALEKGEHIGDNENGLASFPPVKVDRTVRDDQTIKLGETVLTAHPTPGHTAGCTTWTLPVVERGRPLNVMFYCSTSVAGNVLVGNKAYPDIVADYRATFAKLALLPVDVLLPNHPDQTDLAAKRARQLSGDVNAFIDPTELPRYVETSRQAFETELVRQQKAAK